jgi:DNA mismatch repair ATPase MutS
MGLMRNYKRYVAYIGAFIEYWRILSLTDIRNYNKLILAITKHKDDFHDLYKTLGEVDLAVCVLSWRKSLPYCTVPVFHDVNRIDIEDAYHPLLGDPVPNSGAIKRNSIITGSNASGKSTFIKTLAVNGILAQTINTCTAKKFATRLCLVMTSMALRDDILEGESYFITEIKSLKRILDRIPDVYCVCYIDEILRGTNTVERIAASASVLGYLCGQDCLCVAASHDIELTRVLGDRIDNYHFREHITDDGMEFDYKLKPGVSDTRNALKLLRHMNFDSAIVENAEALAAKQAVYASQRTYSDELWESVCDIIT